MIKNEEFITTLNSLGKQRKPFLFAIDFEAKNFFVNKEDVLFKLEKKKNYQEKNSENFILHVKKRYVDFDTYKKAFDKVIEQIKKGNTYLLNLTFSTHLENDNLNLEEIFYNTQAPFKLYVKDKFVCFSPERFVCINENIIKTYPMKGTIDASIKNAKEIILENKKEMSEHVMAVDLLRNDLGIIATNVRVEKFRFTQVINAGAKKLLQVSSQITADMDENWHENIGSILAKLLPAGSICGTPKRKTTQLIQSIETHKRGFFTGVFGYFDGKNFDSAVMIRFIEKTSQGFVYKSGGGLTCDSKAEDEYQEMKDKVYIPL